MPLVRACGAGADVGEAAVSGVTAALPACAKADISFCRSRSRCTLRIRGIIQMIARRKPATKMPPTMYGIFCGKPDGFGALGFIKIIADKVFAGGANYRSHAGRGKGMPGGKTGVGQKNLGQRNGSGFFLGRSFVL